MSRSHSFGVELAGEYGVSIALMLNHFSFWYLKNRADGVHFYKGDYWVRMKIETMQQYYPYFSKRQLRHLVDKMIDLKLLKQDEFNDKKNDRTKWYCLTKKSKNVLNISSDKNVTNIKKVTGVSPLKMALKSIENLSDKNVSNVSDKFVTLSDKNVTSNNKEEDTQYRYYYYKEKIVSNISLLEILSMQNKVKIETIKNKINEFVLHCQSIKKIHNNDGEMFNHFSSWIRKFDLSDRDLEKELDWFIKVFNYVSKSDYKITDSVRKGFSKQFAVGYTGDDFKNAVINLYSSSPANKFHIQSNFKFATPEYLLKDDNLNKYLNFKI